MYHSTSNTNMDMLNLLKKRKTIIVLSAFVASTVTTFLGLHYKSFECAIYVTKGFGNNQYGTKTAYFWIYPKKEPVRNKLMTITLDGRRCNAIHINLLARHGARYTGRSSRRSFSKLQDKLKHNFTNQTYNFINSWVNRHPVDEKAKQVSALGELEMLYIGEYFGTELQDLFKRSVLAEEIPALIHFSTNRNQRTKDSAAHFIKGLQKAVLVKNLTTLERKKLRFNNYCKRQKQAKSDMSEVIKFETGPIFQKALKSISTRLGSLVPLTPGDARKIYLLCAMELANMNNADWCTLLSDEDRKVLEYYYDIGNYFTRWYGYESIRKTSCPPGMDIFSPLDYIITSNDKGSKNYAKGMFQFGHTNTIGTLFTGLGLFNDFESIRADNYHAMGNRKLRSTAVGPFSTHLAFILYNCGGTGADNYALRLIFNGNPLSFPTCNSDVCWYKDVKQGYKELNRWL